MPKPVTFVLVHGAWRGGWCYRRVAGILRNKGHQVYTPTLTGLGERSHLLSGDIDCSTHIRDIVNVIRWEQLTEVVLCGHSYGGMVITGVADAIPEQIASLIYLDAIIPHSGLSVLDQMQPADIAAMVKTAADHRGRFLPPAPAALFNVNPSDCVLVDSLCTPQPIATFIEGLKLSGAHLGVKKKAYVLATHWQNASARHFYDSVKDDPDWSTFEVLCGHDVMLDAPQRLAEILLEAA